jgi:hypothetical protein
MSRMAIYTWQEYKTNEDILSELKIKPSCKEDSKLQGEKKADATCSAD